MQPFSALQVTNDGGRIQGRVVTTALDAQSPGDVVIRAAYSSVNYKDALAVTGRGRILRRFPLVAGIDVAGIVEASADGRFAAGDAVLVTGYDFGVAHDGGFAGRVRVPGDWVVPLPPGLTLFESMALGTAGFTAALAVEQLEHNGLTPGSGPVAVTGATGGVGSIATAILARRGYEVHAITGKAGEGAYLREMGARTIVDRRALELGTKPLEKATWAGAVDAVGGELLSWLVRSASYGASVASTGLAGGIDLHLTVMPFILRGVNLLGVDSVMCEMTRRRAVWERLATDFKPDVLGTVARVIPLEQVPSACEDLLAGGVRGRFVVQLGES